MIVKKLENKNYKKIDSKGFYDGCNVALRDLFNLRGVYIAKRAYYREGEVYLISNLDGSDLNYLGGDLFHNSNLIFIK